jgi:hypothetical protein
MPLLKADLNNILCLIDAYAHGIVSGPSTMSPLMRLAPGRGRARGRTDRPAA